MPYLLSANVMTAMYEGASRVTSQGPLSALALMLLAALACADGQH